MQKFSGCLKLLYVLMLSVNIINGISLKSSKLRSIDIDDFLDRVIESEKFQKIAEKIADKAVEKFQKQIHFGTTEMTIKPKDAVYRASEATTIGPDYDKIETTFKVKPISEEKGGITSSKNVFGKIDSEAFKKRESNNLKQLSLKYKYFTKNTHRTSRENEPKLTDIEDTTPILQEKQSSEEKVSSTTMVARTSDEVTKINDSSNRKKDDTTKNTPFKKRTEKSAETHNEEKNISKENTQFVDGDSDKEEKRFEDDLNDLDAPNKSEKKDEETNDADTTTTKHTTDSEDESPRPKETKHPTGIKRLRQKKPRKSGKKKVTNRSFRKDIHIPIPASEPETERPIQRSDLLMLRKEGNKIYTHEKNPEYEEYHNEMAQKEKKLES